MAVGAREDRQADGNLRLLPVLSLEGPAGDDVEELVRAPNLHIRAHDYRVVTLHQRVQELVDVNRLAFFQPQLEVLAVEELGHGEFRRQVDDVLEVEGRQPISVALDQRQAGVEHAKRLAQPRLGVRLDFVHGEHAARRRLVARVADDAGHGADQEGDLVPELLKLAHLEHRHQVS